MIKFAKSDSEKTISIINCQLSIINIMPTKLLILVFCVALYACNKKDNPTSNTIKDKDGNIYTSIDIGNQRWLVQNLRTTHYNNGDTIRHITDNTAWKNTLMDAQNGKDSGAWCYYKNNVDTGKLFGCLYNYYAVIDPRGIAPQGYHVADTNDYHILIEKLGDSDTAGGILKDTTKNLAQSWQSPNTGASNLIGFTALPGGARFTGGTGLGGEAYFWTSTLSPSLQAYLYKLRKDARYINRFYYDKPDGYSVRCVKNIN